MASADTLFIEAAKDQHMNTNGASLPLPVAQEVDRVCDRFEAELRADHAPKIEEYLGQSTGEKHASMLRSLLQVEIELLGRQGKLPSLDSYQQRFAEQAETAGERQDTG